MPNPNQIEPNGTRGKTKYQSSTTTMTERERERRTRLRACLFVCMKILLFFFLFFLPFIARDYSCPSSSSSMESNCDLRERERDRESTPFPFWIFPLLFPSTKQNLFFFCFFLFPFSNTPSQRRAAQERDPFSLLSFPFLSSPLFPFLFCVCVC